MTKAKLMKATVLTMILAILSRLTGFLREMFIASSLGTTYQADAYNMSLTIPNIMFVVIGSAIVTSFIPLLSESYKKNGKKDMYNFANSLINLLLIVAIVLCFISWRGAPFLVSLVAPNFDSRTYELTVELTRVSILNILFMSMNSGYGAILQTLGEFTPSNLEGIVTNIPIIIYIIFGAGFGVEGLAAVTILGFFLRTIIHVPWLIKQKYSYSFKINIRDIRIKKMLMLISPILIGTGATQINQLIGNIMASGLGEGSVSALSYASKLYGIMHGIFVFAVLMVIYPELSKESSQGNMEVFTGYVERSINYINLVMIPSTIVMMALKNQIVSVFFRHGVFDELAVEMTSQALLYMSIGLFFIGIRDVLNKAFYSIKNTVTPMKNGIIGIIANIVCNLILVRFLGIGGLGLGMSISTIVCSILLLVKFKKSVDNFDVKNILTAGFKIIVASSIMGLAIILINNLIKNLFEGFKGELLNIVILLIPGMILYFIILKLLNVGEFEGIVKMVNVKIRRLK